MTQTQQIWAAILFYAAVQGIFVTVVLLMVRRGRRLANQILAVMVLTVTFRVIAWFLIAAGLLSRVPVFAYVPYLVDVILGPLFYFYTRTLLQPDYKPGIPALAATMLLPLGVRFLHIRVKGGDAASLVSVFENLRNSDYLSFGAPILVAPVAITLYSLVFMFLAWRQLSSFRLSYAEEFTNGASQHVRWLKILSVYFFTFGFMMVVLFSALFVILRWYAWMEYAEAIMRGFLTQAVAIAVFFLPEALFRDIGEIAARRRRTVIDDTNVVGYMERLLEYMELARPHRDEDLRLRDLAKCIGMSDQSLSVLLNEHLRTNFSDFINQYRVNDVQEMLRHEDNDQYTLLAVAKEAGFNSKTSFYRVFRKHTGMSPAEYRVIARAPGWLEAN